MENYHIILVETQKPDPFFHQLLINIMLRIGYENGRGDGGGGGGGEGGEVVSNIVVCMCNGVAMWVFLCLTVIKAEHNKLSIISLIGIEISN